MVVSAAVVGCGGGAGDGGGEMNKLAIQLLDEAKLNAYRKYQFAAIVFDNLKDQDTEFAQATKIMAAAHLKAKDAYNAEMEIVIAKARGEQ